jgi:non-ribosomal peptide synthetase component F
LTGFVEYNTDLVDAATMRCLLEHYQTLLQAIVADPGQTLSALLAPIEVKQRPPDHKASPAVAPVTNIKDKIAQREAELAARLAKLPAAEQALLEKRLQGG